VGVVQQTARLVIVYGTIAKSWKLCLASKGAA